MSRTIVIEGPDRVGKATQVFLLSQHLKNRGYSVKTLEVPILGPLTYPIIYLMLKLGLAKSLPNLFQTIQVLNRLFFQKFILPFFLKKYDYIIFDRWALSSLIYGNVTGVNQAYNSFLFKSMFVPDVTLVISGMVRNQKARDSYESDKALQAAVRAEYAIWCGKNPNTSRMIDSMGSRAEVHQKVLASLYELFKKI